MSNTDSGWRKRQIALDKKAENARELGLDYEPSKTLLEMAREAGFNVEQGFLLRISGINEDLERFAELVRAEERNRTWTQDHWTEYERNIAAVEREACAKLCDLAMLQNQEAINELEEDEHIAQCFIQGAMTQLVKTSKAIRARGQA